MRRVVIGDRVLLALLGLASLTLGTGVILVGAGVFGQDRAHRTTITQADLDDVGRHQGYYLAGVLVVCAAALALAVRWLLSQATSDRTRHLDSGTTASRTRIDAAAISSALAGELESYPGVSRANVTVQHAKRATRVLMVVRVDGGQDPAQIREHVQHTAVPALATTLTGHQLDVVLRLRPTAQRGPRAA